MKNVILFGASLHAKYTIDIIELEKKYNILGIVDNNNKEGTYAGHPVLGTDEDLLKIVKENDVWGGLVAIGDNWTRYQETKTILEKIPDFIFISAVHPSTILGKNVTIGGGTVIMAGVIINTDCKIGESCFIATNTSIDHDSQMDDFSSVSAGSTIGGSVHIGFCTAVALGVRVIHKIKIGKNCVIGAGTLVVKNLDDNIVAYGFPAKVVRPRANSDKYL